MLIDMHAHSKGISKCCRIPYEEVFIQAKEKGIDGVVLTNHYAKSYVDDGDYIGFAKKYIKEYYDAKKHGDETGFKVFFGIEVTAEFNTNIHLLIYGVEPEFLLQYPMVYDLSLAELYKLVKSKNGLLIQAHPHRNGCTVLDTDHLDGIEINCHPLYKKSYFEKLQEIAEDNKLILTCGGDYHADTYRPKCGMILPDDINDHFDIRDHLLSQDKKHIIMQEPDCPETQEIVY